MLDVVPGKTGSVGDVQGVVGERPVYVNTVFENSEVSPLGEGDGC